MTAEFVSILWKNAGAGATIRLARGIYCNGNRISVLTR